MTRSLFSWVLLLGSLSLGCSTLNELTEIRLDEDDGIPPISGEGSVEGLDNLQVACGDAFVDDNGIYEITTVQEENGCRIFMVGAFEVVDEDDYQNIPDLSANTVELVEALELDISVLAFSDGETGQPVDIASTFTELTVSINEEQILDRDDVLSIPTTVRIEGSAVDGMRDSLVAREPVFVTTTIEALVDDQALQNLPSPLNVEFEAQPAIIVSVVPQIR